MNPIDRDSQHSGLDSKRPTLQDLFQGSMGRRRMLGGTLGVGT